MSRRGPSEEQMIRMAKASVEYDRLLAFIAESNRIERIETTTQQDVVAHQTLLYENQMTIPALEAFVATVSTGKLRNRKGRNVTITDKGSGQVLYRPPEGGGNVTRQLNLLLEAINTGSLSPVEAHMAYETLHPFTDGNGRSGRALWLWQVQRQEPLRDPFGLSFLHRFYYDALAHSRARP